MHIMDRVKYVQKDDMGEVIEESEGTIISIFEDTVQVLFDGNPIMEIVSTNDVVVTKSLVQDVVQLANDGEFQNLLKKIEEGFEELSKKPPKKTRKKGTSKARVTQKELELNTVEISL